MSSKSMHKWLKNEFERLSSKWTRCKPRGCGYNRLQPIVLSKSVAQMINNPLPANHQIKTKLSNSSQNEVRSVLNRSQYELEDFYPVVQFTRLPIKDNTNNTHKYSFYRNCSTRVT